MPPRRQAITAVAIVLFVIAASAVGITGYAFLTSSQSNNARPSVNGLRVVSTSVTVHGEPAFIGLCEAIAASCPPSEMNASLNVELINYNDDYYYVHNDTVVSGGTITETHTNSTGGLNITTVTGNQSTVTYTAWFTNSTLYCVTPNLDTAPTCPIPS
jgi:hypothetical protein